jgi:hypothetical protein
MIEPSAFSNCRDWHAFLAAAQSAIGAYPKAATASVATALEAGHAWFTKNAAIADGLWADLLPSQTLGV